MFTGAHCASLGVSTLNSDLQKKVFGPEYLKYKVSNADQWTTLKSRMGNLKSTLQALTKESVDYYTKFKRFMMQKKFGNISRVWRKFFDKDGRGFMELKHFVKGCNTIGFLENTRVLFWQLGKGEKEIALEDFEPNLAEDFESLARAFKKKAGSVLKVLQNYNFVNVEDKVDRATFENMCLHLPFLKLVEEYDQNTGGSKQSLKSVPSVNFFYLFDHIDLYAEGSIYPDELLALEKLVAGSGALGLSELFAERTVELKEREERIRDQEARKRSLIEDQFNHCRLVEDLKATRNCGKQMVEKLFLKLEKKYGSVLKAWL